MNCRTTHNDIIEMVWQGVFDLRTWSYKQAMSTAESCTVLYARKLAGRMLTPVTMVMLR